MNNPLEIKSFQQYLKEDVGAPATTIVSYTFMDGTIPISETTAVSFESFDPLKFGPHVTMEPSGLGPVVYIDTPFSDGGEIYVIRFTSEFFNQQEDLNRYLILLRNQS